MRVLLGFALGLLLALPAQAAPVTITTTLPLSSEAYGFPDPFAPDEPLSATFSVSFDNASPNVSGFDRTNYTFSNASLSLTIFDSPGGGGSVLGSFSQTGAILGTSVSDDEVFGPTTADLIRFSSVANPTGTSTGVLSGIDIFLIVLEATLPQDTFSDEAVTNLSQANVDLADDQLPLDLGGPTLSDPLRLSISGSASAPGSGSAIVLWSNAAVIPLPPTLLLMLGALGLLGLWRRPMA